MLEGLKAQGPKADGRKAFPPYDLVPSDLPAFSPSGLPVLLHHANGLSIDGLGSVKNLAPFSVMYKQSSKRIPNSP